jgi:tRNA-(ms[2]io[6]A)-hydroxylase
MSDNEKVMLGLRLPTDPRWVRLVKENISEILTDHAWCEQKAASHAISTIVRFPEYPQLVDELTEIALEEMEHFKLVNDKIRERGYKLGFERKDNYVRDLAQFIRKGGNRQEQLAESLLFAAMIEARSCERFRMLSEKLEDADLVEFYRELMISEAGHYTTFLRLARTLCTEVNIEGRWKAFLDYEGHLMKKYGVEETMHG